MFDVTAIMLTAQVALLMLMPSTCEVRDCVDLTEINYYWDCSTDRDTPIFVQAIWWEWNSQECRLDVVDWRIMRDSGRPVPVEGRWEYVFFDQQDTVWRCVASPRCIETHTCYDPELEHREAYPQCIRRGLRRMQERITR